MTTSDSVPRAPRPASSDTAVLRLERINKNLLSLRTKLNSYMCEPKTLTLYQRLEILKRHLDDMRGNNTELMQNFQDKTLLAEQGKTRLQQQIDSYKNLELKVLEYIGMAKLHC
ncbi:MAG: hypothetical protein ACR2MM_08240 [Flavobacteriaceae bacterium]